MESSWTGWTFFSSLLSSITGSDQNAIDHEMKLLADTVCLNKASVVAEGFVIYSQGGHGKRRERKRITALTELPLRTTFHTERGTSLFRRADNELILSDRIEIPICRKHPAEGDADLQLVMRGKLLASPLLLALENFTRSVLSDGLLFYEEDRSLGRLFKSLAELTPGTVYVRDQGRERVELLAMPRGKFHFRFQRCGVALTEYAQSRDLTVMAPAKWKQEADAAAASAATGGSLGDQDWISNAGVGGKENAARLSRNPSSRAVTALSSSLAEQVNGASRARYTAVSADAMEEAAAMAVACHRGEAPPQAAEDNGTRAKTTGTAAVAQAALQQPMHAKCQRVASARASSRAPQFRPLTTGMSGAIHCPSCNEFHSPVVSASDAPNRTPAEGTSATGAAKKLSHTNLLDLLLSEAEASMVAAAAATAAKPKPSSAVAVSSSLTHQSCCPNTSSSSAILPGSCECGAQTQPSSSSAGASSAKASTCTAAKASTCTAASKASPPADTGPTKTPTATSPVAPTPSAAGAPPPPPPPAPPPPPGIGAKDKKAKGRKLRPLRWVGLQNNQVSQDSFWHSVCPDEATSHFGLDVLEVQNLFSASPVAKQGTSAAGKRADAESATAAASEPASVSLLDVRKANNIGISLAAHKLSPTQLVQAIETVDQTVLTGELASTLTTVFRSLTRDELVKLRKQRSLAEQYARFAASPAVPWPPTSSPAPTMPRISQGDATALLLANRVPQFQKILDALDFQARFPDSAANVASAAAAVRQACDQVRGSAKFAALLKLIFAVGNVLNRDTYLAARGFRIESLLKLSETRSKSQKNLLQYIVSILRENNPDLLLFTEELSSVAEAAKVPLNDVEKEVNRLDLDAAACGRSVAAASLRATADPCAAAFSEALKPFAERAVKEAADLLVAVKETRARFNDLAVWFGESDSASDSFFDTLDKFNRAFAAECLKGGTLNGGVSGGGEKSLQGGKSKNADGGGENVNQLPGTAKLKI